MIRPTAKANAPERIRQNQAWKEITGKSRVFNPGIENGKTGANQ